MPFNWIGHRHQQRVVSIPKIRWQSMNVQISTPSTIRSYNRMRRIEDRVLTVSSAIWFCLSLKLIRIIVFTRGHGLLFAAHDCISNSTKTTFDRSVLYVGLLLFIDEQGGWEGRASVRIVRMHSAKLKPNSRVNNCLATNRTTLLCFSCGNLYSGQLVLNLHMLSSGAI